MTWVLCACPILVTMLVHALYVVEWIADGEEPNMLTHGPDNLLERALYEVCGAGVVMLIPAGIAHLYATLLAIAARIDPNPTVNRRDPGVLLLLLGPAACWLITIIVAFVDPTGAWAFFID